MKRISMLCKAWPRLRRGIVLAVLSGVLGFSGGCELIDSTLTPMFMVSPDEEVKLGLKVAPEIEKDLVLVDDPQLLSYLRDIGAKVQGYSPITAQVPVNFYLVQNDEINAFAIPGGNIYVHTGLIYAAEDEAELASVIAHEYGHVVYRHSAQHLSRANMAGLAQSVLLGEDGAQSAKIIADLVATGALQNYSRKDESEADDLAVQTLYRAGWDPHAMSSFFDKLRVRYGDSGGVATWFSSHPATSARIVRVNAAIDTLPPKNGLHRPVNQLRKMQARLISLGLIEP